MMAKVKIKDHDRHPEFSVAVVVGTAVVIWFIIQLWSIDSSVRAVQRDITQIEVTYFCDGGHRFLGKADTKSLPCAREGCQLRAWPVWSYQCTRHGAFQFQLRYSVDQAGRSKIRAARVMGGAWQEIGEAITCPRCERVLLADITARLDVPAQPGTQVPTSSLSEPADTSSANDPPP